MVDYLQKVRELLGESRFPLSVPGAWQALERELVYEIPASYRWVVDSYGPVQLNWHLHLGHPAVPWRDLRIFMREVCESFTDNGLAGIDCPGFEGKGAFYGPGGLIPLTHTDRGEYLFLLDRHGSGPRWLLAFDRDEDEFYEYRMDFGEWLYRYLVGEDMFGPGSAVFYPGPVKLDRWPTGEGEQHIEWFGPAR
ncbi:SMI1/KNR4 family protein [Streptomyces sp. YIM 98790]|uniref:SMI1/KNR4 family protein n=1 Tax=Streptomyces sp. YIM 98790 TaxID=2689077 RepID=UPI00140DEBBE|nr:SMI1/KNR4 family protein [Streptomyces sp. YIM 98790]